MTSSHPGAAEPLAPLCPPKNGLFALCDGFRTGTQFGRLPIKATLNQRSTREPKLPRVGIHKIQGANPSSDSPFQASFAARFMGWSSTTKKSHILHCRNRALYRYTSGLRCGTVIEPILSSTSTVTAQQDCSFQEVGKGEIQLRGFLGGIQPPPRGQCWAGRNKSQSQACSLGFTSPPGAWRAFMPRSILGNWN